MITVDMSDSIVTSLDLHLLEQAAQETLRVAGPQHSDGEATILLTGDEQLQELNLRYLEVDAPTDVLSFPAGYIDPDSQVNYLGDILISYPRAQAQAAIGGHADVEELRLLVVHGMLHLLGFDHAEPEEKAEMWGVQTCVLKAIDCPLSPP